jgi:hypothetical protein
LGTYYSLKIFGEAIPEEVQVNTGFNAKRV